MIIKQENRRKELLRNGVPSEFLDAIDNTKEFEDLEFTLKYPDNTYWFLPNVLPNYEILKGYDVTPIYEGINGDTFYVLLSNSNDTKFVHFELENDEIYDDYGDSFKLMFVNLLIDYYELSDEISLETLSENGIRMGFPKSKELFKSLEKADNKGLRKTFELDKEWRKNNVFSFL